MIERRKTATALAGTVPIGSGHPLVIQSMTKVMTTDVDRCIRQIRRLTRAGCDLVRIAVPTQPDTKAFAGIVNRTGLSLVADIHFSPERAIEAIEAGAAKIRLNPGNIKEPGDIERIIDCAKMHRIAIRIGVNEASIRDLKADVDQDRRVGLMVQEMSGYVGLFEKRGFTNLVLSVKSADTLRTIEANRAIAKAFGYPIHIGLTHAGLPDDATVPSAVALGTLLAGGIGDTIRVSVAGDPVREVQIAQQILQSLGLYESGSPTLIVCPTCGRCQIDVVKLARQVRRVLKGIHKPIRVAVMGCVVNGPGEAADADVAVCAAKGKGFLYRHGKKIAVVPEEQLLQALQGELRAS
ncbi:MAG: flavodoxin-dependent (E)-4-hydroxy-3-methylbut-2-enyl-diphosphate synthase [Sedimentisphaerales bacterium]|nr:flavodoxin-dependent (E)-4-hydroxy-3-methylbut-2-enyl-diphosphate synthase [Sedimentisphaerales bacterium]